MQLKFLKQPLLELTIMFIVLVLSYIGLSLISFLSQQPAAGEMGTRTIVLWLLAFFLISFGIGIISIIAGIGGGIIFTPVMMAFTPVNSVVIRATGLLVAMFCGLMATGSFLKRGIGNLKMCMVLVVSQGLGALLGAQMAISAASSFGDSGEGVLRVVMGGLVAAIAVYMFAGGKKMEWPNVQKVDALTKWMGLEHTFHEASENKIYTYKISRILLGLVCIFGVGFMGGFFGMGGGWAITPVQNLVLGVPLKVAAANSGIIIGMVDCIAVLPYMLAGGIIPLFVLPWVTGQVMGAYLGTMLFVKIKVLVIRYVLIGIMTFTSFGLISDGLEKINVISKVPGKLSIAVFLLIMAVDLILIVRYQRKKTAGA